MRSEAKLVALTALALLVGCGAAPDPSPSPGPTGNDGSAIDSLVTSTDNIDTTLTPDLVQTSQPAKLTIADP